jgi:DNA excision repair protein ERCC-3
MTMDDGDDCDDRQQQMDVDDDDEEVDEYASAKKLVQRAADREALLKLFKNRGANNAILTPASASAASAASSSFDNSNNTAATTTGSHGGGSDFSSLPLKSDHFSRPCWTCPNGTIYLEAFHPLYATAYDFLVAIAEPIRRPEHIHEYQLTPYSLYAAVATNIDTASIIRVLNRFSKNVLPAGVATFIKECTKRYGKAKLVLKHNRYYVESDYPEVLRELLRDDAISQARVVVVSMAEGGNDGATTSTSSTTMTTTAAGAAGGTDQQLTAGKSVAATTAMGAGVSSIGIGAGNLTSTNNVVNADGFLVHTKAQEMEENLRMLHEIDGDSTEEDEDENEDDEVDENGIIGNNEGGPASSKRSKASRQSSSKTTVSFQIKGESVEIVKRRAIE